MHYPDFFDAVPRLRVRDPLADFLGAADGGVLEYSYLDAVRLAGHSCPTVASAYWLTRLALGALYGAALPERGGVRVALRESRTAGVSGVIANVVSLLTGASAETGFKGIGGHFERRGLLDFEATAQPLALRFTRLDNGLAVDAEAQLGRVPADPAQGPLLMAALAGTASAAERQRFGALWQDRVRRVLLEHGDDPEVYVLRLVEPSPPAAPETRS